MLFLVFSKFKHFWILRADIFVFFPIPLLIFNNGHEEWGKQITIIPSHIFDIVDDGTHAGIILSSGLLEHSILVARKEKDIYKTAQWSRFPTCFVS